MSKKRKCLFLSAVFLLLSVVWTWRYFSMNAYYDNISTITSEIYEMHEEVPFSSDWIQMNMSADGYSLTVNRFEIVEYEDYLEAFGFSVDNPYPPEKLALVHVTLHNKNSDAEGVMLTELQLGGIDSIMGMDWDILTEANPILERNFGICLPVETECNLILPYDLYSANFGSATWRNIEEYNFLLRLTIWPTEKKIALKYDSNAAES